MYIISIDVGTRNFAACVCNITTSNNDNTNNSINNSNTHHNTNIVMWRKVDLVPDVERGKSKTELATHRACAEVQSIIDGIDYKNERVVILIERQLVTNGSTSAVSNYIQGFLHGLYPSISVHLVPPALRKHQAFWTNVRSVFPQLRTPEVQACDNKSKNARMRNGDFKRSVVRLAILWTQTFQPAWSNVIRHNSKKDDLADALIQALAWHYSTQGIAEL